MSEIHYRLAEDEDIPAMVSFYNRLYKTNRTIEQFRWEFRDCPHGEGFHVVAESEGAMAGMQGMIPIVFHSAKGEVITGKSEDTLVDPVHRGKGIFNGMYELMFAECRRRGIQCIWGYTKAVKPFRRIGFEIPFQHEQALTVFKLREARTYLSGLDPNARWIKQLKITVLCVMALLKRKSKGRLGKSWSIQNAPIDQRKEAAVLQGTNWTIKDDAAFLGWRFKDNPNTPLNKAYEVYHESRCIAKFWIMRLDNGAAFLEHFHYLSTNTGEQVNSICVLLAELDVTVLRDWTFAHTQENRTHRTVLDKAGMFPLKLGISFVFHPLDSELKPNQFVLNRLSTEGV